MIDALSALLRAERRAIATVNLAALAELAVEKATLISALSDARAGLDSRAVARLLSEAEANRALINDALDALRDMLGVPNSSGLYDARARVRAETGSLVGTKL